MFPGLLSFEREERMELIDVIRKIATLRGTTWEHQIARHNISIVTDTTKVESQCRLRRRSGRGRARLGNGQSIRRGRSGKQRGFEVAE